MKKMRFGLILILGLGIYAVFTSALPVGENQWALVLQFGKTVRIIDRPGLHWKWPDPLQTRLLISGKIMVCDPESQEYLTEDKKNIVVDYFYTYRIVDPLQFHNALKDRRIAEVTLDDLVNSALGSSLGNFRLSSLINTHPEETGMDRLLNDVTAKTAAATADTGVLVGHISIKRLLFPKENEQAIFARMFSERQKIATQYRSEGMEQANKIKADAKMQAERLLARARKEAEHIRGQADAEALAIYADTWRSNPELYTYIRKLEMYRAVINEKDVLVLPNDFVGEKIRPPEQGLRPIQRAENE